MDPQEKDYILNGVAATIFFAIFGPVAVMMIWFFVGLFILDYRQKKKKYEDMWGKKK